MKEFNKQNLPQVRIDLNKVLKEYGDKIGLTVSLGNIKFSAGEFSTKLDVKIKGAITQTDTIFERQCMVYNLGKIGDDGRELTGYNSKAHAYPFQYTQGGKRFKCSTDQAKKYFSRSNA